MIRYSLIYMNKKILVSLSVIAAVAAIAIGGTVAYFSDTETSTGNTISAGVIDLTITGQTLPFTLEDMKPGYEKVVTKKIVVTSNPSNVWMMLKDFVTGTGVQTDAECKAEGGIWHPDWNTKCTDMNNEHNDLDSQIYYDLSVCIDSNNNGICDNYDETVIYSFDEKDLETLASLKDKWIPLKMNLAPGTTLLVMQSFHFNEEAGNVYQGDILTFNEEFVAYQKEATSPTGNVLFMENKDPNTWQAITNDGMNGKLTYNSAGLTFDYTFEATGLVSNGNYSLIYYADCGVNGWPGNCPGAFIASFTADGNGKIIATTGSVDLGKDLPSSGDYNYPAGAKIWLVTAADYNSGSASIGPMTGWHPTQYLFENNPTLIHYEDTNK